MAHGDTSENDLIEQFARRHEYHRWRGVNTLPEELFVWRFLLPGPAAPGWTLERAEVMEMPGLPRSLLSLWKEDDANRVVQLEVVEYPSRGDAHRALVHALWEFQSPLIRRQPEQPVGDVTFTFPGDTATVFARANLVIVLRSVSVRPEPITPLAHRVDRFLVSRPRPTTTEEVLAPAAVRAADQTAADIEQEVPLEIDLPENRERPAGLKIFAPSGEIASREGRLVYRARQPGPHRLTVSIVTPTGEAAARQVDLRL
jgi:hypothetical protein